MTVITGESGTGSVPSAPPAPAPALTLSQLFAKLKLVPWFALSPTQTWGHNGELGEDYGMRAGTPVGAAAGGKVVAIWSDPAGSSVGTVVQVEDASGGLWHYQHLRSASVHVGDQVFPGTVVGASGGCPTGGYAASGTYCTFTDKDSTGPHIEVRYAPSYNPRAGVWNQAWQNPTSRFAALGGTGAGTLGTTVGSAAGQTAGTVPSSTGGATGCTHSVTFPAVIPGQSPTVICLDPAIDMAARTALILVAIILVVMAVYLFTKADATLQGAVQQAQDTAKTAAKVGAVAA